MDQQDQINSVFVKINMVSSGNDPRFVVEEVIAQPGSFEGVENLLRARFECLCCKTGYVVLPSIMQTTLIQTEMKVSFAENDPTTIQQVAEHVSVCKTESILDEVVDSDEEQKHEDEFDDVKMEAELLLPEDSFEMAPLDNQFRVGQMTDLEEGDFGRTPSERSFNEIFNSNEGDGHADSEMEAHMTFPMDIDADSVGTPSLKNRFRFDKSSDSEERVVLTPSEVPSLKLQSLRSKAVIRLVRVDEEAREKDVPVAPVGPQKRNVEGGFYTCDICKTSIKYRCDLTRHMNNHLGIRYSCSECQASFTRKSSLIIHKRNIHQNEVRICEVCKRSKTCTKAEYHSHLRRRHPNFHIKGTQPTVQNFNGVDFPCIYCEPQATFTSFRELKEHLSLAHDRNFACTRCPTACYKKAHLNTHIESVHEKKKFKCPKCDKVFAWKVYLKSHIRSHT